MTVVLTKSCARDAPLLYFQVRAVHRHVDRAKHLVVVERDEAAPVREAVKDVEGVEVLTCGDFSVADPYLRQQFVKISMGGGMLHLDSDMIPERRIEDPERHRWTYERIEDMPQGVKLHWEQDYLPVDEKLWGSRSELAYMTHGCGWFVSHQLALSVAGAFERLRRVVREEALRNFSEYHFMGRVIVEFKVPGYKISHVGDGVVFPEIWVTSGRVPTTDVTRARLRKAAGL